LRWDGGSAAWRADWLPGGLAAPDRTPG
jgi:hypothetical protein